jgi:hypothetical protein
MENGPPYFEIRRPVCLFFGSVRSRTRRFTAGSPPPSMNLNRPSPSSSFEDPRLKSAIRRAWGRERAPTELKERVKSALATQVVQGARGSSIDGPSACPPTVDAARIPSAEVDGPAYAGTRFCKRPAFAPGASHTRRVTPCAIARTRRAGRCPAAIVPYDVGHDR